MRQVRGGSAAVQNCGACVWLSWNEKMRRCERRRNDKTLAHCWRWRRGKNSRVTGLGQEANLCFASSSMCWHRWATHSPAIVACCCSPNLRAFWFPDSVFAFLPAEARVNALGVESFRPVAPGAEFGLLSRALGLGLRFLMI